MVRGVLAIAIGLSASALIFADTATHAPDDLRVVLDRADAAFAAGLYVDAARLSELALAKSAGDPRSTASLRSSILTGLGLAYAKSGSPRDAESAYAAALLEMSARPENELGVRATKQALARVREQLGRWREAEALWMELLDSARRSQPAWPGLVAEASGSLASHYGRRGDPALGLQTYHHAIESLPEDDEVENERASLLVGAGELYSTVGAHQEAANALREAVLLLASGDDRELETALTLYRYAAVLRDGGRLEEAKGATSRALGLAQSVLGEESTETFPYLSLYATLAAQTGDEEEANRIWERISTLLDPSRRASAEARMPRCRTSTGADCRIAPVDP